MRLTDVRNFTYRTRDDFDVRYEEREVSLAHLTSIDFFISYWTAGADRAHVPQLQLRQRAAGQHFDRDASGDRRGLFADRVPIQAVRTDLRGRRRARHRRACAPTTATKRCSVIASMTSPENARRLVPRLSRSHQRTGRQARVLSPAEQQLHGEHRPLRQRLRPRRRLRHPPSAQRFDRPVLLRHSIDRYQPAVCGTPATREDQ